MPQHTDGKLQSPGGYRPMPSSREAHCAYCKQGITPDKRLHSCAKCHRHYHPACYGRTLPGKPIGSPNWTCRRCLDKTSRRSSENNHMSTSRSRDHDNTSTSSYGNTAQSATSASSLTQRRSSDMAAAQGGPTRSWGNSINKDRIMGGATCAWPSCFSKPVPSTKLCSLHSTERTGQSNDPTPAPPSSSTWTEPKPLDNVHESILPIVRRKTGFTGLGPLSQPQRKSTVTKLKHNEPSVPAQKQAREPPSPSGNDVDAGPARKKVRLNNSAGSPSANADVVFKKPWDTSFNLRPTTKPRDEPASRAGKGKSGTTRIATHKTQRKFAPAVVLTVNSPPATRSETKPGNRPVSESPVPPTNGDTRREASLPSASPRSNGKEFIGNESVRAWFQRRESAQPDRQLGNSKASLLRTQSFEKPLSIGSTPIPRSGSVVKPDAWVRPPSLINLPGASPPVHLQRPLSQPPNKQASPLKPPPISQQYHEGWHFPSTDQLQLRNGSTTKFDSLIYSQDGAGPPPPGLSIARLPKASSKPPTPKPEPEDEPFYAHIDPRAHWQQPHSAAWYEKKMQEIQARGGRKANFGRAAQRLREQRARETPVSWEDSLPERIRQNPAWVRALRELGVDKPQDAAAVAATPKKRGRPGPKPKTVLKRESSSARPKARKSATRPV